MKRVLIIGLDGATFNVIQPMVEAGRLPVISSLMNSGSWGELRSTILPVTPPAWASFMTGKNSGKHGVYGFYATQDGSYETKMVSGRSIRAKKIWDYLDKEKVGLVDIPMTYPPEPINGFMISGWPVPSDDNIFTHPPELHTEVIREVGEYWIDKTFASLPRNSIIDGIANLYRYTKMRRDAALYLLKNKGPFDLFVIVFRGTDFVQHEAFKFFDEDYCRANPEAAAKYKDLIYQFYERMDQTVGELVSGMGENAVTIIMSDHGGGPMKKKFYINRWFKKEGFLAVNTKTSLKEWRLAKRPLSEIMDRLKLSHVNQILPSFINRLPLFYPKVYQRHPSAIVNWEKTKSYANLTWTDGVVNVNLMGRDPKGIVPKEDYENVRDEIIRKLKDLEDPETGEKIIQDVLKKEDIYKGPFMDNAPDICILTKETSYYFSPALDDGPILEKPDNPAPAPHRMEGVFIINGEDIKPCGKITGLDITDIAPTVLYLMGKQIPESMDGKVIREAINEGYFMQNIPLYYKDDEESESASKSSETFSTNEEEKIAEGLKALGYME